LVAEEDGVKAFVGSDARCRAARSAGRLATVKASSTRSEGPQGSRSKLEEGFLDWYVILDDERSDFAAAKIEKDHGILKGSTPSGERRLAHDVDFAKEKLNKRSEEHTSELQSRFDLVCRLLLEKKKTK